MHPSVVVVADAGAASLHDIPYTLLLNVPPLTEYTVGERDGASRLESAGAARTHAPTRKPALLVAFDEQSPPCLLSKR